MNIFHYILLGWLVLAGISLIREAIKAKNKIRTTVTALIVLMWCAFIILSAYY